MKKQTPFLPILILAAVGFALSSPAYALRKQQAKNSPSATAGLEEFLKNPVENTLAAAGLTPASPAAGLEEKIYTLPNERLLSARVWVGKQARFFSS